MEILSKNFKRGMRYKIKTTFGNKSGAGFSLPELLVVVAMILLMTGLILPNWRSGERTLALDRVVHKAGQDVRRVQELALRAQIHNCSVGTIQGYGIYFNESNPASYIIYAECSGNFEYDLGLDDIVETVLLASSIQIANVNPSSAISVLFIPPTPLVFIKPGDPSSTQVSFQRVDGVGVLRILDISSKGVIDID